MGRLAALVVASWFLTWCLPACGGGARGGEDAGAPAEAARDAGGGDAGAGGTGGGLVIDASVRESRPEDAPEGGAKACRQALEVSRTCKIDEDCLAVTHTSSCCGSMVWIGVRLSTMTEFDTLEAACDRSYPECGCAALAPTTDDGSTVVLGNTPAVSVSCQAGTCKTFATACGHPCGAGRTCAKCSAHGVTTVACTEPKAGCGPP